MLLLFYCKEAALYIFIIIINYNIMQYKIQACKPFRHRIYNIFFTVFGIYSVFYAPQETLPYPNSDVYYFFPKSRIYLQKQKASAGADAFCFMPLLEKYQP